MKPGGLQDIKQVDDHLNLTEWMKFLALYNKYEKKNKTKQQNDFFEPNLVGSPWEDTAVVTLTDPEIRAVTNDKKGLDAMRSAGKETSHGEKWVGKGSFPSSRRILSDKQCNYQLFQWHHRDRICFPPTVDYC